MPLAHPVFFEEPREYTDEQIEELRAAGLLRDDTQPAPNPPASKPPAPPADQSKENK